MNLLTFAIYADYDRRPESKIDEETGGVEAARDLVITKRYAWEH